MQLGLPLLVKKMKEHGIPVRSTLDFYGRYRTTNWLVFSIFHVREIHYCELRYYRLNVVLTNSYAQSLISSRNGGGGLGRCSGLAEDAEDEIFMIQLVPLEGEIGESYPSPYPSLLLFTGEHRDREAIKEMIPYHIPTMLVL